MTDVDRRRVLALLAAGALAAGCAGTSKSAPATRPAGTAAAPGGPPATPSASAASSGPTTETGGATTATSPEPAATGPAVEVVHGSRTGDAVALTFHGQGSAALARSLLSEAERAGARVTVLAVGSWLTAEPSMATRILDGGHELGNHTMNHRPMARMDAATAFTEIERAEAVIGRLTGSPGAWFRPSGTPHASRPVLGAAGRAGYRHVLSYDVDSLDYTDPGATAVIRTVAAALRPGSVVSLHLGHPGTVEALPALLDLLASRHLRAVTASALLRPR